MTWSIGIGQGASQPYDAGNADPTPRSDIHARALDIWESEGGSIRAPASDRCDWQANLSELEVQILQCLGAAVLSRWNGLPTRIQHELFERSFDDVAPGEAASLKRRIARFLHEHKDDAGGGI